MTARTTTCGCTIHAGQVATWIDYCSLHDAASQMYQVLQTIDNSYVRGVIPEVYELVRLAIRTADGEPKCPHGAPSVDQGLYCSQPSCEICRARKGHD